jgi:hypothetical protein
VDERDRRERRHGAGSAGPRGPAPGVRELPAGGVGLDVCPRAHHLRPGPAGEPGAGGCPPTCLCSRP